MKLEYSKYFNTKSTLQTDPIPGMVNQIKNNAGGFVFQTTKNEQLERFLTFGCEGGTFYVSERDLTIANAKSIVELIKKDGTSVVNTLLAFDKDNRAPKQDTLVFVLALVCAFGSHKDKQYAYTAIKKICRTSTHLFQFCQYIQDFRGWSRGLRNGVSDFYLSRTPEQVAYQLIKYRQRNGWTHKDVLRLAHPKANSVAMNQLFGYAVGKVDAETSDNEQIQAYEAAQTTTDPLKLAAVILDQKLTWEMIPTNMLNEKLVQQALIENMSVTALLRNLNRFTISGLLKDRTGSYTKKVVETLKDVEVIKAGKIHPINVLNTMKVYARGYGFRGDQTWEPNQAIVDALQDMFELSFEAVEPTGKDILIGVDVSGSMGHPNISNMALSPREAAAALMLTFIRTEPNLECMYFSNKIYPVKHGKRTSYTEILESMKMSGGTDCSLPYRYALDQRLKVDAVITLTDSETWHGNQHPIQTYAYYKHAINPNTKAVVVAMVANNCTLFPTDDYSALNVAGFDAAIPNLISNFIK